MFQAIWTTIKKLFNEHLLLSQQFVLCYFALMYLIPLTGRIGMISFLTSLKLQFHYSSTSDNKKVFLAESPNEIPYPVAL